MVFHHATRTIVFATWHAFAIKNPLTRWVNLTLNYAIVTALKNGWDFFHVSPIDIVLRLRSGTATQ
jgi:hypothetical protein